MNIRNGLAAIFEMTAPSPEVAAIGMAAAALVVGGTGMAIHKATDSLLYGQPYDNLRSEFSTHTVKACNAGHDAGRAHRLEVAVRRDLDSLRASYSFLPSRQAGQILDTVKARQLVLMPVSFHQATFVWPAGAEGFVYNNGKAEPVFAYRALDQGKLATVADQNLPQGVSVLHRDASGKGSYRLEPVQNPPANPCLVESTEAGNGRVQIKDKVVAPAVQKGMEALERVLRP